MQEDGFDVWTSSPSRCSETSGNNRHVLHPWCLQIYSKLHGSITWSCRKIWAAWFANPHQEQLREALTLWFLSKFLTIAAKINEVEQKNAHADLIFILWFRGVYMYNTVMTSRCFWCKICAQIQMLVLKLFDLKMSIYSMVSKTSFFLIAIEQWETS